MDIHNFEFDSWDVSARALHVLAQAYIKHHGAIPDMSPFPKPLVYDNTLVYEDNTLDIIAKAVNVALRHIVEQNHPGYTVHSIRLQPDIFERIAWTVFGWLKLLPIFDDDETYDDFSLDPNYGEQGHIDMKHNRIHYLYERLQEAYDTLIKTHNRYLNERYDLLEEFMLAKNTEDYEWLLHRLELLSQKIASIRTDIIDFSDKNNFLNPFIPSKKEEESQFESAIHWNQNHADGAHTESFEPSIAEQQLASFLPKDFQVYEWDLYHFEFSWDDVDDYYLEWELDNFRKKQYERKMLVLYHARIHLALHRRGTLTLSPNLAARMKKNVSTLEQELDDIRRLMMNWGNDVDEQELAHEDGKVITYDITGVDELCTRAQNIVSKMDMMHIDVRILRIFERLTGCLSTFLTNCINIRTDDTLDNTDKADILATFRQELLEQLGLLRSDLAQISLDDRALDAAEEIIWLTLDHLSQY